MVTMHAVELLGVRLMLLFSALPALALLLAVALIDGLVARYVRRECGGHESATRHTRAKRLLNRGIVPMVAVVWLIVPAPMSLAMFFFPVAVRRSGSHVGHGQVLQEIFVRQKMHASWRSG